MRASERTKIARSFIARHTLSARIGLGVWGWRRMRKRSSELVREKPKTRRVKKGIKAYKQEPNQINKQKIEATVDAQE